MRLIDAEKISIEDIPMDMGGLVFIEDILLKIEELPTVDAVPVVHGHWVGEYEEIMCSSCRRFFSEYVNPTEDWSLIGKPLYCPNCGAKMDGKVEEDENKEE